MIDIRYHVTSLVAVFLALGIGVIIGLTLAPGTSTNLTKAIKHQTERVDVVLAEYERDHAVLGRLEEALSTIVPTLVRGKLTNRRVAIIQTGDDSDTAKSVADAVEAAGGTVSSTTIVTAKYDQLNADNAKQVRVQLPDQPTSDDAQADLVRPIAVALRQGVLDGSQLESDIGALHRENLIETAGTYAQPVVLVVIVGGLRVNSELNALQVADRETNLVKTLTEDGTVTAVGGEGQNTAVSSIQNFRNAGIATVDCLDRAIGKLDVVYALNGEKAGFGVRPTADRVIPVAVEDSVQ